VAEVALERRDRVLVLTIDRPHVRNAISPGVARELAAGLDELDGDSSLSAGVITGAGGYFSAGMDLKAFAETGELPHVPGRGFAGLVERPPAKPLIAAVEGFALAGGLEIALACDIIVAARGSLFGLPEVTRGLVAAAGGLLRLGEVVSRTTAMHMALTGEPIAAERAAELGMVNILSEPGGALDAALGVAGRIAENAPLAVSASKAVLLEAPAWDRESAWLRQRALIDPVLASEDAREGARAFRDKRRPLWQGR